MNKEIIGSNLHIDVLGCKNIPAKIDTGADSSAIWVSDLKMTDDGVLKFKLFDKQSPFYTGEEIEREHYKAVITRSSHGEEKLFYRTNILINIKGHKINALMTLANRCNNKFPILIGKRTLKNRFLVDVSKQEVTLGKKKRTARFNQELQKDSIKFHQKYFGDK